MILKRFSWDDYSRETVRISGINRVMRKISAFFIVPAKTANKGIPPMRIDEYLIWQDDDVEI